MALTADERDDIVSVIRQDHEEVERKLTKVDASAGEDAVRDV